ncbi:hypothetical protein RJ55_01684 [Drechmeria coniospora]|nr:hypothetical protein RJ55_01684 [Drechmeria coniospora]
MLIEFATLLLLSFIMAHIIPATLLHRLRSMETDVYTPNPAPGDTAVPGDTTPASDDGYNPTPIDIAVTRIMLVRSLRLPPDLVDAIFDFAEYWAHSTNAINYTTEHQDCLRVSGSSHLEDRFLLRSYPLGLTGIDGARNLVEELAYDTNEAKPLPLSEEHDRLFFAKLVRYPTPRLANPCRKIVFSLRSRDQGYGGQVGARGTYRAAWTWFEAGLERFDATQDCDSKCTYDVRHEVPSSTAPQLPVCSIRPMRPAIQRDGPDQDFEYVHPLHGQASLEIHRNKVATWDWQDHVVTWSYRDNTAADSDGGKVLDEEGRGRATGDGSFVRGLKIGDVVTVWAKARFPGWINFVESVKIDIYWAV